MLTTLIRKQLGAVFTLPPRFAERAGSQPFRPVATHPFSSDVARRVASCDALRPRGHTTGVDEPREYSPRSLSSLLV
ncbi:hypothetical protein CPLU01_02117 [Colletotrichum plurivorum]|uniref:Uncharacterized protein n=1 Tax=Colletotrichum plurivorum TaxID=2175906 RepID=A0A8H6NN99_9PEZI|nr:hypothetical protein CPLU01_02117 [Colletotrichum plurivorum]